ncbi:tetratricopeptide repeat protein 10, tpr10, putative [Ixodes scapularis]|uniref:Tetratricopeptide repeat protein 10, tpr10, putative n=1 Tax=Ixodes scapularis TaxID=6945 RepID=B7QDT7_IXOSC|nr:tetratricopeptide repeat protein 10, tpr10, putative [Ixodes scapularis]|eukprot:XP_002413701.1 tetratricopeptide repeat protein 10, tpr10, putative [Ixodes scapularis]
MKNIGLAFVKMGQLADAITSLEYIMAERADFRSALHLIVCHYTIGDRDKMKRSFLKLLDVVLEHVDDEKGEPSSDDPIENLYYEEIKNDSLQQIERERRHEAEWCILTAAKLIAPVISTSFSEGYEWCVEQIKASAYSDIANDLEISKAVAYLRKREFNQSYRYFPSNIEIIEWLGAYYIESQLFEKAIKYFEKAAIIQPAQVKWQLMVASCHRKSGNYQNALQTYKTVHRKFPDNIECLRFLVRLTTDLGMNEASEYAAKLKKAEKAKELKEHRPRTAARRRDEVVDDEFDNEELGDDMLPE